MKRDTTKVVSEAEEVSREHIEEQVTHIHCLELYEHGGYDEGHQVNGRFQRNFGRCWTTMGRAAGWLMDRAAGLAGLAAEERVCPCCASVGSSACASSSSWMLAAVVLRRRAGALVALELLRVASVVERRWLSAAVVSGTSQHVPAASWRVRRRCAGRWCP